MKIQKEFLKDAIDGFRIIGLDEIEISNFVKFIGGIGVPNFNFTMQAMEKIISVDSKILSKLTNDQIICMQYFLNNVPNSENPRVTKMIYENVHLRN